MFDPIELGPDYSELVHVLKATLKKRLNVDMEEREVLQLTVAMAADNLEQLVRMANVLLGQRLATRNGVH